MRQSGSPIYSSLELWCVVCPRGPVTLLLLFGRFCNPKPTVLDPRTALFLTATTRRSIFSHQELYTQFRSFWLFCDTRMYAQFIIYPRTCCILSSHSTGKQRSSTGRINCDCAPQVLSQQSRRRDHEADPIFAIIISGRLVSIFTADTMLLSARRAGHGCPPARVFHPPCPAVLQAQGERLPKTVH